MKKVLSSCWFNIFSFIQNKKLFVLVCNLLDFDKTALYNKLDWLAFSGVTLLNLIKTLLENKIKTQKFVKIVFIY